FSGVGEDALDGLDGIEYVQVSIGSSGSSLMDAFSGGAGVTYSIMTESGVDQEKLRADVLDAVDDLEGVGEISVNAAAGFGSSDIEIDITAPNSDALAEATEAVAAELDGREGIGAVTDNLAASLPYIAVVVDREAAADLGLSGVAVGSLVSNTMRPQQAGSIELNDTALTVYIAA